MNNCSYTAAGGYTCQVGGKAAPPPEQVINHPTIPIFESFKTVEHPGKKINQYKPPKK